MQVRDNYIADPLLCSWRDIFQEQTQSEVVYKFGDVSMMEKLQSYGNILSDPNKTIDLKSRGFKLPPDLPAFKLGFKPIPFKKIGLYKDDYRKQLPRRQYP